MSLDLTTHTEIKCCPEPPAAMSLLAYCWINCLSSPRPTHTPVKLAARGLRSLAVAAHDRTAARRGRVGLGGDCACFKVTRFTASSMSLYFREGWSLPAHFWHAVMAQMVQLDWGP
jgi:hypothetical protein